MSEGPDVAAVQDVIHLAKGFEDLGTQQPVGIGDHARDAWRRRLLRQRAEGGEELARTLNVAVPEAVHVACGRAARSGRRLHTLSA